MTHYPDTTLFRRPSMERKKRTDLISCRDAATDAAITLPPKTKPVATANAFVTAQSSKMKFQRLESDLQ